MTAARGKQTALPRDAAESVAAEIALALEREQEQRLARNDRRILRSAQEITALAERASADTILSQIAASCTEESPNGAGAGAAFALIGHRPMQPTKASASLEMEFAWESGDASWTGAVGREPLASLWRSAIEGKHVMGANPPHPRSKRGSPGW